LGAGTSRHPAHRKSYQLGVLATPVQIRTDPYPWRNGLEFRDHEIATSTSIPSWSGLSVSALSVTDPWTAPYIGEAGRPPVRSVYNKPKTTERASTRTTTVVTMRATVLVLVQNPMRDSFCSASAPSESFPVEGLLLLRLSLHSH